MNRRLLHADRLRDLPLRLLDEQGPMLLGAHPQVAEDPALAVGRHPLDSVPPDCRIAWTFTLRSPDDNQAFTSSTDSTTSA